MTPKEFKKVLAAGGTPATQALKWAARESLERAAYMVEGVTQSDLALKYGVSRGLVSMILTRKYWGHVV